MWPLLPAALGSQACPLEQPNWAGTPWWWGGPVQCVPWPQPSPLWLRGRVDTPEPGVMGGGEPTAVPLWAEVCPVQRPPVTMLHSPLVLQDRSSQWGWGGCIRGREFPPLWGVGVAAWTGPFHCFGLGSAVRPQQKPERCGPVSGRELGWCPGLEPAVTSRTVLSTLASLGPACSLGASSTPNLQPEAWEALISTWGLMVPFQVKGSTTCAPKHFGGRGGGKGVGEGVRATDAGFC